MFCSRCPVTTQGRPTEQQISFQGTDVAKRSAEQKERSCVLLEGDVCPVQFPHAGLFT